MNARTYTGYSIGCAIVWAVIWIAVGTRADERTRHEIRLGFIGWVSGWTSATIARALYPPPGRRVPDSARRGLAAFTVVSLGAVAARLLRLLRRPV